MTKEWMEAWLVVFGHEGEPYVVTVRDQGGNVVGLAPLFRFGRRKGPLKLKLLRFMGTGVGADHLGFMGVPLYDTISGAVSALVRDDGWDVVDLTWLAEVQARNIARALEDHRDTLGFVLREAAKAPLLRLPSTWEAYVRTLGPAFRAGLGRELRRLERERGACVFRRVTSHAEFESAWDVLVRMHQARASALGRKGAFADANFAAFHRCFGHVALDRSWLRFYVLEVGGEPLATLHCFKYGPRVYYFQSGFDLASSRYGPGRLLMAFAIRSAIEEGATEFDFMRGMESYKLHWRPDILADYHLTVYRRHLLVRAALWGTSLGRRAGSLMSQVRLVRARVARLLI